MHLSYFVDSTSIVFMVMMNYYYIPLLFLFIMNYVILF